MATTYGLTTLFTIFHLCSFVYGLFQVISCNRLSWKNFGKCTDSVFSAFVVLIENTPSAINNRAKPNAPALCVFPGASHGPTLWLMCARRVIPCITQKGYMSSQSEWELQWAFSRNVSLARSSSQDQQQAHHKGSVKMWRCEKMRK